jgi:hypothetical protein
MRILILGGYGVFGGRLAELLADVAELELLISGRSLAKAQAFCADYQQDNLGGNARAQVRPVQLDRADIEAGLRNYQPDLVVDASGPFQDYAAADRYQVISACIAAQTDYLDFADGADFVFGVSQWDAQAQSAGVFVLTGVSSFPVLTSAVLREIARDMDITTVEGGIAPSPFAGIGLNVMRAVLGYAGAPVKLLRHGVPAHGVGLAESMRYTVAVPGLLPLQNLHFSLVDVPDLQIIPPDHPGMTDIWMGAGPVPEILHRVLNVLAKARATFNLPSLVVFSRLFYWVLNAMRFGEHRGGMFIRAKGLCNGRHVERSWHLLAEGDDGPYIPSMAIEAIVRKLVAGTRPAPGARAGTHALELADYHQLFASRAIYTGFRTDGSASSLSPLNPQSLYQQVLGSAFTALPKSVQAIHTGQTPSQWSGTSRVVRGKNLLARMLAALIGFPPAQEDVPVTVLFEQQHGVERWTRNFGGQVFSSEQWCGTGRNQHLLVERFGLVAVSLALVVKEERLYFIPRRWSVWGLPLPRALLPQGNTFEYEENGRFCFHVEICAPIIGLIVAYTGQLAQA